MCFLHSTSNVSQIPLDEIFWFRIFFKVQIDQIPFYLRDLALAQKTVVIRETDQDNLPCNWNMFSIVPTIMKISICIHFLLGAFTKHWGGVAFTEVQTTAPSYSCLSLLFDISSPRFQEGHDCNYDLKNFCSQRYFFSCAATWVHGAAWPQVSTGCVRNLANSKLQFKGLGLDFPITHLKNCSWLIVVFSLLFQIITWARDFWKSCPF